MMPKQSRKPGRSRWAKLLAEVIARFTSSSMVLILSVRVGLSLGRRWRHPGQIHFDRGEQAADLIVDFACDAQTFLLLGILDMRGKLQQLLLHPFDFEFAQLALRGVEDDAFPARQAAWRDLWRGAKADPLDFAVRQGDAPFPVPETQGLCRFFRVSSSEGMSSDG